MTPQAILDSLRRANPMCILCRGTSGHPAIVGDGPPRCFPCVMRMVRMSAEPPPVTKGETPPWSVGP